MLDGWRDGEMHILMTNGGRDRKRDDGWRDDREAFTWINKS